MYLGVPLSVCVCVCVCVGLTACLKGSGWSRDATAQEAPDENVPLQHSFKLKQALDLVTCDPSL